MNIKNLILAIAAMIMVTMLPIEAQVYVPNDGWEWDTTSTMTYHNMFFTDSSSAHGFISAEFSFNGDDATDVGKWTKKFNLKFLPEIRFDIYKFPTNDFGTYFTIELHHKDTILIPDGVGLHILGPSSWITTGFNTWQGGTIDSIDAISIKFFYIPPVTSFAPQRIRFDKLRFWTYEQGELAPFYSFGDSGTIQGIVFNDSSANGLKEPAEDVMAGCKVHLEGVRIQYGEIQDSVKDSVLTDSLGRYQFKPRHGQYRLWQEVPSGFQQTVPLDTYYININCDTLQVLEVNFGNIITTAKKYAVKRGWNIVSVPLLVTDFRKETLFPTAISDAFTYAEGGYQIKDTLSCGIGYWVKFPRDQNVFMSGDSLTQDSIEVVEGWNMIGSLTQAISVGDLSAIPPEMVASNFFGYNKSYVITDSLRPGQGYWVKVDQSGSLILGATPLGLTKIRICDQGELPPVPPDVDDSPLTKLGTPTEFQLTQNYPNPFNPTTTIKFLVPSPSALVTLKVYNLLGQEAATLVNGIKQPGEYTVVWNAGNQTSGIYLYRLQIGDKISTKKMVLIK